MSEQSYRTEAEGSSAPLFLGGDFSLEDFFWGTPRRRRVEALRHYILTATPVLELLNAKDSGGRAVLRLAGRERLSAWREVLRGLVDLLGASPLIGDPIRVAHERFPSEDLIRRIERWASRSGERVDGVAGDAPVLVVLSDNLLKEPEGRIARVLLALADDLRRAILALLMAVRPTYLLRHGLIERLNLTEAAKIFLRVPQCGNELFELPKILMRVHQWESELLRDDRIEKITEYEELALRDDEKEPKPLIISVEGGDMVLYRVFFQPVKGLPLDRMLWCHLLNFVRVLEWSAVLKVCPGCGILHTRPAEYDERTPLRSAPYCSQRCSDAYRQRKRRARDSKAKKEKAKKEKVRARRGKGKARRGRGRGRTSP